MVGRYLTFWAGLILCCPTTARMPKYLIMSDFLICKSAFLQKHQKCYKTYDHPGSQLLLFRLVNEASYVIYACAYNMVEKHEETQIILKFVSYKLKSLWI